MSLLDTASLIVTPNGYKEGKLYSVIPSDGSGDLSVTRATTATRVNSAGLVELVPYNLLTYSEQFDNAAWLKQDATINANAITAPNGTLTADTITDNSSLSRHIIYQSLDSERSLTRTLSTYAKQGTLRYLVLSVTISNDSAACYSAIFDLQTGTITATKNNGSATINATIENAGNGWYRCVMSGALGSGFETIYPIIATSDRAGFTGSLSNNNIPIYAGSGQGLYIWGAQLVEGSVAKDYQKTETRLNIPRLDYSNGTCPSILVEPQRTNRLFYSERLVLGYAFAYTSGTFTVTENTTETLDPFGNYNAEKFNATTQANNDSYTSTSGSGNLTLSIFAKKGTNDSIQLYHDNVLSGGAFYATFNLTSGTITASSGTASIQDLGNGWFRCSVSGTDSNSAGNIHGVTTYTGSTYLFGIQLEQGNYVTSYIPTTNSSVTRNADVISKTGISSLIGQTEGTIFWEGQGNTQSTGDDLWILGTSVNDTSTAVLLYYIHSTSTISCFINNGTSFVILDAPMTITDNNKVAVGYKNGNFVMYLNGSQVDSSTSAIAIPSGMNQVAFNKWQGATGVQKQSTKAAALWKTRLTNAQLATLTTI